MRLELGGGVKPRGDGWVNMDILPHADIVHDLDVAPWPIADGTVEEVYSSHCIEHLNGPLLAFNEIARIGMVGAVVEIRVPHPISHLAMIWEHKHCFSPIAAINMERFFPAEFWRDAKRLRLEHITYGAACLLDEMKAELPFLAGMSDDMIVKWIPGACHECCYHYTVVDNEYRGQ